MQFFCVWHTANVQWMIAIEFKIIITEDYLKGTKQKYPSKVFFIQKHKTEL